MRSKYFVIFVISFKRYIGYDYSSLFLGSKIKVWLKVVALEVLINCIIEECVCVLFIRERQFEACSGINRMCYNEITR